MCDLSSNAFAFDRARGAPRDGASQQTAFVAAGYGYDDAAYRTLVSRPISQLRSRARQAGVRRPARLNRAQLARVLERDLSARR